MNELTQLTKHAPIYRIELGNRSLWYTHDGKYDPIVAEICKGDPIAELPMPYDSNVNGMLSACQSLDELKTWFPIQSMKKLIDYGFRLFKLSPKLSYHDGQQVWFVDDGGYKCDITYDFMLAPCPFCGGIVSAYNKDECVNEWDILCKTDGCFMEYGAGWYLPKDQLLEMWNHRQTINK